MKLLLMVIFIALPFMSYAQGFKIKIGQNEFPTDKVPEKIVLPQKLSKFLVKKETRDNVPNKYIVQIGEEEHSFLSDGAYHEVEFSHDIKGMAVYILDGKRSRQGKVFVLKKL